MHEKELIMCESNHIIKEMYERLSVDEHAKEPQIHGKSIRR